ncbi:hypothetical protein SAMN02927897_01997 [Kosakonia sacchari]|uniref:Uncharacterized protein n=1 Tax=Kosakonia sacchari TaxID=1158459 RepID=A0A1G4Y5X5_9ENTR|nr:hypothetical protein SAMN02927897_01997 [Kosakonia sacchari]
MTGSESKVGYIQTFLTQRTKININLINDISIKTIEVLVIIKFDHYPFISSRVIALLLALFTCEFYCYPLELYSGSWRGEIVLPAHP